MKGDVYERLLRLLQLQQPNQLNAPYPNNPYQQPGTGYQQPSQPSSPYSQVPQQPQQAPYAAAPQQPIQPQQTAAAPAFCPSCGVKSSGEKFCQNCGAPLR